MIYDDLFFVVNLDSSMQGTFALPVAYCIIYWSWTHILHP